jgi:acetylornithine deacetylase/succinyl-diaminopimelate desuccinylase-like protein
MENIKSYVQENKDRFIKELIELLKIPSVSADYCLLKMLSTSEAVKLSQNRCDFVEICETAGYLSCMEKNN